MNTSKCHAAVPRSVYLNLIMLFSTYNNRSPNIAADVSLSAIFICSENTTLQNRKNPQISLTESIKATAIQRGCYSQVSGELWRLEVGSSLT